MLMALWPDGVVCELDEVEEYMNAPCAKSDDYIVIDVYEVEE